ncbi:MAG: hypothetical protein ABSE74_04355 [Methanoregula sp.]
MAGPKNFGAKVENPKNFPVEILKSEKNSGKIRNVPKIFALIWLMPEKIPARMQQIFHNLPSDLCRRVAKPTKSQIRSAAAPDPFSFSGLYPPNAHMGMSKGAPRHQKKKEKRRREKNGRLYHKHYHQERDPQPYGTARGCDCL